MKIRSALFALATFSLSAAAVAGPQCTEAAKDSWLPEATMKQKIADAGYVIDKFKVTSGNCYEIYGKDKAGQKVEIYFNPVDGSVAKEKRG
ncbi:hypothetical protein CJ010_01665 [Azoarcus sp. DD4]|uniref:PepSY domain-containing protein n=1 Tax=Azoarcus sp. DD4 TaxID=2027405 RepID=UPI00112A4B75|nr:PepSY domain-containing protein [Azoarcus sp. DD4]QDF95347.1 hypothetical protein CJ010_01665 [Azoarcus sp. DD4]